MRPDECDFDLVRRPPHYCEGRTYEPIKVIGDWFGLPGLLAHALKYIARAGRKGPALEDLRKAQQYLAAAIELEETKR